MAERKEKPKSIEEKVREIKEKGYLNYESPRINKYESRSRKIIAGTVFPSDERLKENIMSIENALGIVMALNVYNFKWKGTDVEDTGLLAQEVEKVFPKAVKTLENGIKVIDYNKLIALIIQAIKEIKEEIDNLKS
ncbi:MAG: tail fiber domain-containing protein [candidate division WOR-3 bacterium]